MFIFSPLCLQLIEDESLSKLQYFSAARFTNVPQNRSILHLPNCALLSSPMIQNALYVTQPSLTPYFSTQGHSFFKTIFAFLCSLLFISIKFWSVLLGIFTFSIATTSADELVAKVQFARFPDFSWPY